MAVAMLHEIIAFSPSILEWLGLLSVLLLHIFVREKY